MEQGPTPLFATRRVFATLAFVCAGGIGLVAWLGPHRAPAKATAIALVAMTGLCAVFARSWRDRPEGAHSVLQAVGLGALGALTAPVAWFFGPNSSFASVVTLVLVTAGLLGETNRRRLVGGAMACTVTMLGQAVVTTLVLFDVLADDGLVIVKPPGHPLWHHAISHVAIQVVYLVSFVMGRAFRKRYAAVAAELDQAVQLAARRDAQLEEARTAYQRALAVSRHGIFSGATLGAIRLGELVDRAATGEVYSARNLTDGTTGTVRITRGAPLAAIVLQPAAAAAEQSVEQGTDLHARIMSQGPLGKDALRELVHAAATALTGQTGELRPTHLAATAHGWRVRPHQPAADVSRFSPPERSDNPATTVYSLAACTYYAITATEPFSEIPTAGLAQAIATRAPLDPRLLSDVSDDVARVLQIGLARTPSDRFADVTAFAAALTAALAGELDTAVRERATRLPAWSTARPLQVRESTDRIAHPVQPAPHLSHVVVETPPPIPATSRDQDAARRSSAWQVALHEKLRRQRAGVLALCAGGAVMLGAIAHEPVAWWAAELGIAGVALVLMLLRDPAALWPWPIIAALGMGPAYAFGLHSGFAAVIAVLLFAGGAFRPATETIAWHRHGATALTMLVVHAATFAAIAVGWIPDAGNLRTIYPAPAVPGTGAATEALLLVIFATAFTLSRAIDVRFTRLVRRNELLARTAAYQEVVLATARADLDRATAGDIGGLFTGSLIGGYTVGKMIGRGGMGEVYEAERAGARVALKMIRADRVSNPDNLKLFSREASTLQRVHSPYVARVIDVGTDAGVPYMAMDLVAGSSLAELLRTSDRLSTDALSRMIHDVTRGLEDVHRAGVLHLDIKPANLVLTRESDGNGFTAGNERWKLIDFGIAELVEHRSTAASDVIMGTPAYMAPELIDGATIDARTDLFSLCAVIYRALTGRPAWSVANAFAARTPPLDPCRLTAVPLDVGLVLRIGLATDPSDRFASAAELAAAFDAALAARLDSALRRRARLLMLRLPWSA